MDAKPFLTITVSRKTSPWGVFHAVAKALDADPRRDHPSGVPTCIIRQALDPCGVRHRDPWGPQPTAEEVAKEIREQADVEVVFREDLPHEGMSSVTTEDLIVDAVRRESVLAQEELARRGIDWTRYANCR
jgi:hypothetical protein